MQLRAMGYGLCLVLMACSSESSAPKTSVDPNVPGENNDDSTDGDAGTDGPAPPPLVAARPYELTAPKNYDPAKPTPVVLHLHGYDAAPPFYQAAYFGALELADKGYIVAYPSGMIDSRKKRFWNATSACCNFDGTKVDDVAYLGQVLDDIEARFNVDKKRVYVTGHSNGAFMAHRLACEISPRIAAIASLAGAVSPDASGCKPSEPVAILQIHGDADQVIKYPGGSTFSGEAGRYTSAHETVAQWATRNGCTGELVDKNAPLDLDSNLAGHETKVEAYAGCSRDVMLWTTVGGGHQPSFTRGWIGEVESFLSAHPKP